MKNIFKDVLFFFLTLSYTQNESRKLISLAANLNYPVAVGNNFLSKGYSNSSSYDLTVQVNITKHLFFGGFVRNSNEKLKNAELIGDFDNSSSQSFYGYIGYSNYLTNKKMYLEHFIGYGIKDITNTSLLSNYVIQGDNSYLVGSRFNYVLSPDFCLFGGLDFNYTTYTINLSGPYKDFYSKSMQFTPSLGIKLSFGDVGLKKKPKQLLP